VILIENSEQGIAPWTVSFDGRTVRVATRNDAIRYAAEAAATIWARDRGEVEILLRDGGATTQVGRFVAQPVRAV
jgi:hypothetical protein